MSDLPRLAIGAIEPHGDARVFATALAQVLARRGRQVQLFRGDARRACCAAERAAAGVCSWHLDSWLMPADVCRELFELGCHGREIALVVGRYGGGDNNPSDLNELATWLGLARLGVIDARRLRGCGLPGSRPELAGIVLDGVTDAREFCLLATNVEAAWGIPVVAGVEALPRVRAALARSAPDDVVWREAFGQIVASVARLGDLNRLANLAARSAPLNYAPRLSDRAGLPRVRVAVAYDEAFGGYCPDALELLERWGAEVCDFSPLRDDRLPRNCDLVYLGCGQVAEYAPALAANTCMLLALQEHVFAGRRVLAEGAGLAYACDQLCDSAGRPHALAGLLPVTARFCPTAEARPFEAHLQRDCWLARAGDWLRGYACPQVELTATGPLDVLVEAASGSPLIVARHGVIGSQLQLHYAARPDLLRAFFAPHAAAARSAVVVL